jgi:hypothetical protein
MGTVAGHGEATLHRLPFLVRSPRACDCTVPKLRGDPAAPAGGGGSIQEKRTDSRSNGAMPKARQKVRPNEAISRAINTTDWQPLSGMVKKRCSQCRYFFAVQIAEADTTSRCPDCTRPARPAPAP